MSEVADRYHRVATGFTERANAVPDGAWDRPAPCEGWVARDVVRHLVDWMPRMFFPSVGLPLPEGPSVDDDPAGAWRALDAAFRSGLGDAEVCARELEFGPAGRHTWESAVATFCIGDVLMHTWDLARATGLDETLDPDEVHLQYEGMLPADEMLRSSGHYGARVDVPDDADEQTKLIAFTGRHP
jgi:uncharacterized protein (TIGR03086 family)